MPVSRRHFLSATGVGAAVEMLEKPTQAEVPVPPNDRIRMALVGAGGQGSYDTRIAVSLPGVELAAVADVYDGRLTRAREVWGSQIFTTRDYREILARRDIDAVLIGTPDHWHRKIAVDAMNAGKDVYCEKPMVQLVEDGKDVVETAKRTNRIIQVGSQRVSSIIYQKARELLAAGAVGELNSIEAWIDRDSALGAWQYTIPPDASPDAIDWDRFLGRAPKVPFDPIRLFRWRNYRDYGTGVGGDLFIHLFSGIHFITEAIGPTRVFATGGLRYWKDGRDVPDVLIGLYDYPARGRYPAFNLMLRVNLINGAGEDTSFRFIGSEGLLTLADDVTVTRQPKATEPGYSVGTFPKALQEQIVKQYREKYPVRHTMREAATDRYLPPPGYSDSVDHIRNFFQAVRTRQPVVEDAVFGFRAAGPALLSNVSYFEQRACLWDPETMTMKS
jgi:predicted dehydrogenase